MDCLRLFTKEDVLDGDEKPVWGMGHGGRWACLGAGWAPFPPMPVLPGLMARCPVGLAWRHSLARAVCLPQTCCRCKARTRCTKKFSIQKFPKILVLRILRAEGQGQGVLVGGQVAPHGLLFVPRLLDMTPQT